MRKTKNRNKTKMMVLIVIVVLYVIFLIVGLILDMKSRKKDQDNAIARYLVIDHFANLKYSNKAWHKVSQAEIERYSGLYHVYSKNQYLGEYQLKYGNVWNLFDQNDSYIDFDGGLFAYSNNFDVSLIETNIRGIMDQEKVEMKQYFGYQDFSHIITNDVIDVDLDHNGVMDSIVCISNIGIDPNDIKSYYNLVYVNYNGEIIEIINQNASNYDILRSEVYNLSNIFSVHDKGYFVIKSTMGIDTDDVVEKAMLYDFSNINEIKQVDLTSL